MTRIEQIISQNQRIKDFYNVGPVQRAAVLDLFDEIITECAAIATDCYDYHEPLSHVPTRILSFQRLTDDIMSHKL